MEWCTCLQESTPFRNYNREIRGKGYGNDQLFNSSQKHHK